MQLLYIPARLLPTSLNHRSIYFIDWSNSICTSKEKQWILLTISMSVGLIRWYGSVDISFFTNLSWFSINTSIRLSAVPSGENIELKRSRFKAWSWSVYSLTCYTYCQGFLPCLLLHLRSIHLQFFPKPLSIFAVLVVVNTGSCVGPENKIGHLTGGRFPCWVPAKYK